MEIARNVIMNCYELRIQHDNEEECETFLRKIGHRSYTLKAEIQSWLIENDIEYSVNYVNVGPYAAILFKNEEDSLALKLRWT